MNGLATRYDWLGMEHRDFVKSILLSLVFRMRTKFQLQSFSFICRNLKWREIHLETGKIRFFSYRLLLNAHKTFKKCLRLQTEGEAIFFYNFICLKPWSPKYFRFPFGFRPKRRPEQSVAKVLVSNGNKPAHLNTSRNCPFFTYSSIILLT